MIATVYGSSVPNHRIAARMALSAAAMRGINAENMISTETAAFDGTTSARLNGKKFPAESSGCTLNSE
jgi:hypothetical protein